MLRVLGSVMTRLCGGLFCPFTAVLLGLRGRASPAVLPRWQAQTVHSCGDVSAQGALQPARAQVMSGLVWQACRLQPGWVSTSLVRVDCCAVMLLTGAGRAGHDQLGSDQLLTSACAQDMSDGVLIGC